MKDNYTTDKYKLSRAVRGARRGVDKVVEAIIAKKCQSCGKTMVRKRWNNGKMESFFQFNRRKMCSHSCCGKKGGRITGDSILNNLEKHRETHKKRRAGEYIKCSFCGKEYYLHPSTSKREAGLFCSRECETKSHYTWVNCIDCEDEFEIRKSEVKKIRRCTICRKKKLTPHTNSP